MKKLLRFIAVLLVLVVAGILILGLVMPKDIKVEESIAIRAPKAVVENQMLYFQNFNNWNPWAGIDHEMKTSVTGTDGATGAKYAWEGDETGKGQMLITSTKEGMVNYEMTFFNFWGESKADGYWQVEDATGGTTRAVWGFSTHAGYPWNAMMGLMKGRLAKDFSKGLKKLKNWSETHAFDHTDLRVEEIQFEEHHYAGYKQKLSIKDPEAMSRFFSDSYQKLGAAAGADIVGLPGALFYSWDEATGNIELAAVFPVKKGASVAGALMQDVAPSKAYKIVYTGGYSGSAKAHEELGKYISERNEQQGLVIEEYVKGPGEEPDSSKWVTNIIYLVAAKK